MLSCGNHHYSQSLSLSLSVISVDHLILITHSNTHTLTHGDGSPVARNLLSLSHFLSLSLSLSFSLSLFLSSKYLSLSLYLSMYLSHSSLFSGKYLTSLQSKLHFVSLLRVIQSCVAAIYFPFTLIFVSVLHFCGHLDCFMLKTFFSA